MVEAAIALPVFFVFLVCTYQLLRLGYVSVAGQFVVSEVVRQAVVGPAGFGGKTQGEFINSSIIRRARQAALNLQPEDIMICAYKQNKLNEDRVVIGCGKEYSAGPEVFISVTAYREIPLLGGHYKAGGIAYGRNEKWDAPG